MIANVCPCLRKLRGSKAFIVRKLARKLEPFDFLDVHFHPAQIDVQVDRDGRSIATGFGNENSVNDIARILLVALAAPAMRDAHAGAMRAMGRSDAVAVAGRPYRPHLDRRFA